MAGYTGPYKGAFKEGAEGLDCSAVKRCLKRRQKDEAIKLNPHFGSAATAALREFQKNHQLTVDGIYGPGTHRVMAPLMRGYEVLLYKRAKVRQNVIKLWAILAPGADRPGVKTHQNVMDFVAKTGHIYGHPLIITTGSNHNQYVAGTQRESAHWKGEAADIAMYGNSLTKLGQAALVAAGMAPWRAKLCRGGVYNVGNANILFHTQIGGNHENHCHVGLRV